jgi:hypothetical protein
MTPFPIVYVADVERSAAFYREAFGDADGNPLHITQRLR